MKKKQLNLLLTENTEEEDEQEEYEMPSFFEGIENHWHKDGPDLEGIVK